LFINDTIVTLNIVVTTTWQRFTVSGAVGSSLVGGGRVGFLNNNILTTNDYIEVWGAQYEVGAFSTTYIKTTTASVTRIADTFTRNNIYTNNLISASGGTWFVELRNNVAYTRDGATSGFFIGDSSPSLTNGLAIRNIGGGSLRLAIQKFIATVNTQLYATLTDIVKIAIKWNGTTADVFVNGAKVVSATAFTTTNMEFLNCFTTDVPKYIPQMALFNTALSDVECAALTSDVTDGFAVASIYNRYVNQTGGVIENTNGLINNIQNFK
jgi:hypothetical protein